jgi:hypothetical protein
LDPFAQLVSTVEMDDQRVGRRPLDLEDPRDGGRVLAVGAQTVNGPGRQVHQPLAAQHGGLRLDVGADRHTEILAISIDVAAHPVRSNAAVTDPVGRDRLWSLITHGQVWRRSGIVTTSYSSNTSARNASRMPRTGN